MPQSNYVSYRRIDDVDPTPTKLKILGDAVSQHLANGLSMQVAIRKTMGAYNDRFLGLWSALATHMAHRSAAKRASKVSEEQMTFL